MTDDDWVRRVHEANDDSDLVALIDDLRATRNALSALGRLAHDRDPVIRAWVAIMGPKSQGAIACRCSGAWWRTPTRTSAMSRSAPWRVRICVVAIGLKRTSGDKP